MRRKSDRMMDTMATFETLADAIAAGWRRPREAGRFTWSVDISGGCSFGYRYSLHVKDRAGKVFPQEIGRTRTVHFTKDLNAIRQPGCYAAMYPPEVVARMREATAPLLAAQAIAEQAQRERHDQKDIRRGRRLFVAGTREGAL